ncbi:hypothetical protein ZWY2020_005186 [Hordeum vulgare]|nr:hypothetical protein ZWY2020_005186 [Hordeum vulgare]
MPTLIPIHWPQPSILTITNDQFVYSGFAQANLNLDGAAIITPDGLLELTNGTFNLKGHANPTDLHFHALPSGYVQSFSISFVFSIFLAYLDKSDDGMAFFVTRRKKISSELPARYLGLLNNHNNSKASNHIFVVDLDTNQNSEFHDINGNHVGININSLHSMQSHDVGFFDDKTFMFKNLSLISREMMKCG